MSSNKRTGDLLTDAAKDAWRNGGMSDLDKALAFIREEIEVAKACAENPETDDVVKNYRRVEVLLMQLRSLTSNN